MSRASLAIGAIAGFFLSLFVFYLANQAFWLPAAREEGREQERSAALKKSIELIEKRGKTNGQVNALNQPALCRELGGKWVLDHCE